MLQDPEGYKKAISEAAGNKVTEEAVKKLKSAQNKSTASSIETDEEDRVSRQVSRPGIKSKKQRNIFK